MVSCTTEGNKTNHGDYRLAGGPKGIGQSQTNVFWLAGDPVPARSLGANTQAFCPQHGGNQYWVPGPSVSGSISLPRRPPPRLHSPSPISGLRSLHLSIFCLPASTLLPISEGPEGPSQSRVLICHLYCHSPVPAYDPPLSTRLY